MKSRDLFLAWFLILFSLLPITASFAASTVFISEICVEQDTLKDQDDDKPGWLEIFNSGTSAVDVGGMHLTDSASTLDKWIIPTPTSIAPNSAALIFTSGKDRTQGSSPYHTSFALKKDGGFLALVDRDGQTILSKYDPYPAQGLNSSYGVIMISDPHKPLQKNSPAKIHVPQNNNLGQTWTTPAFGDTAWKSVASGFGFEDLPGADPFKVHADSIEDFSGKQGYRNWYYGYYNKTADADGIYQPSNFIPFPNADEPRGPNNFYANGSWSIFPGPPPWTTIQRGAIHPNGINNGAEHWAIRRWKSPAKGTLKVTFFFQSGNGGVTGKVLHQGTNLFSLTTQNGIASVPVTLMVTNVAVGDFLDFSCDPNGINDPNDYSDTSFMYVRIEGVPGVDTAYVTNIQADMKGNNSTVYARFPFTLNSSQPRDIAKLFLKYDDGYIAYLNGTEISRGNVQDGSTEAANSAQDFSGIQGQGGWIYGYYNRTQDPDKSYQDSNFTPFPNNYWTGGAWDWPNGNPPWTYIGQFDVHPNGSNNGNEHWVIRRWVAEKTGAFSIQVAGYPSGGGDGVYVYVYHNGLEIQKIKVENSRPYLARFTRANVKMGDHFDFALSPQDFWTGVGSDGADTTQLSIDIRQLSVTHLDFAGSAAVERADDESLTPIQIDLVPHKNLLINGLNVLAIHGLNFSPIDGDFLLAPEILLQRQSRDPSLLGYLESRTPGTENGLEATLTIIKDPRSFSKFSGRAAILEVAAVGAAPLSYQWYKNGNVIAGATQPKLEFSQLAISDEGIYHVVVSNNQLSRESAKAIVTIISDRDGDGIPDDWETDRSNPDDPSDALSDTDGDGMTLYQEYVAGTDPADPNSLLRFERVYTVGSSVFMEYIAVSGKSYNLQFSSDFMAWSEPEALPGTDGGLKVIDRPFALSPRFYRLVVKPDAAE